jgi:flagellar protein FliS
MERSMFTSVSSRSAAAYQRVNVETAVSQADPYTLVAMLFDGLLRNIGAARAAIARGDVSTKGDHIIKAVRIIDEGLKPALNLEQGGELAANLHGLYGYAVTRLTYANLHSDDAALAEVAQVMEPVIRGWKEIAEQSKA